MTLTPLITFDTILRSKHYFRICVQAPGYKKECF